MAVDPARRPLQRSGKRPLVPRDAAAQEAPDDAPRRRDADDGGGGERTRTWTHRQWTPLAHALAVTGDRWTLLIVHELAHGTTRLARLKERLPGISSGVLDHHIQRLAGLGLLTRERFREMPPRVELTLTEAGRELLPVARSLARWGMSRMWSPPQEGERIDVAALIEMVPALLADARELPEGVLRLVSTKPGERFSQLLRLQEGRVAVAQEEGLQVTASVEGDQRAWVAALGPARDYAGLALSGDERLATQLLDALPRAS
jgi:DNA-binding HxlR family transcriptional regulator